MLSSHSIVSSSRTVRPYSPWGGRLIGQWRTTWPTVCSFAPHWQAAEEAIPHLYKQGRKRLTQLTHVVLGRDIPDSGRVGADVGDESTESRNVLQPLRIPSVIRPLRRTYVVVARWTDELLCGGYIWVSRFEAPCICTFEWEKRSFTTFSPLEKFLEKCTIRPPGKNPDPTGGLTLFLEQPFRDGGCQCQRWKYRVL